MHALIELVHSWKSAFDSTYTMIRILLVKFSNAFNRVDHHILLTKCASAKCYNQTANVVRIPTQTASEGRQYKVEVHYHQSRRTTTNNIRPLSFVHYINDLRTTCDQMTYVDDSTICEAFSPSCPGSSLQTAADEVAQWTTTNKMVLNYDKTTEMCICVKKNSTSHPADIDK